jgi:hypothetical protein
MLWLAHEVCSTGSCVQCWSLAGETVFWKVVETLRWGPAGGTRSVWPCVEGYTWSLVPSSFCASCLP